MEKLVTRISRKEEEKKEKRMQILDTGLAILRVAAEVGTLLMFLQGFFC